MKIDVLEILGGDLLEEAWELYHQAFRDLNALTVQRHLMYRGEFDEIAADLRIQKWLVLDDDGNLIGLATYTNELDAWPLISPAYFQRRWPVQYEAGQIWYCGFVAVPQHQRGVFIEMIAAMYRVAEVGGGVISLDMCRHNIEAYRLDRAVQLWLTRVSGGKVHAEAADAQTFMIYETAPDLAPVG